MTKATVSVGVLVLPWLSLVRAESILETGDAAGQIFFLWMG